MSIVLKIENYTKPEMWKFHNDRFECINSIENPTCYRWQFKDNGSTTSRFVWIELQRIAIWDYQENEWVYKLNYPKCTTHIVTKEWFSNIGNVMETFKECLKKV